MKKNYMVLLVDDIPNYVDTMDLNLSYDCKSVAAYSAEDARAIIVKCPLDLAILDVRLKKADTENREGIELLTLIKENRPEIPVIMISAYREFEFEAESLVMGAEYFLRKPIQPEEFRTVVERVLKQKKSHP